MIDEAVGLVEKKRMFFSYKMRSNSKNIKIGKFIKYKIDENNESRLSQSLDPVTIRISGNK